MNGNFGHNSGLGLDGLATRNDELLVRKAELIDAMQRVPDEIGDDAVSGKVGDFVKQLTSCGKALDDARKQEKEPFLEAGRQVDAFFRGPIDEIDAAKKECARRQTAYLTKKEAAERARLKAEADALAAKAKDEAALEAAIKIEEAATSTKAAELTRVTSNHGTTVSLRSEWTFRNLDREAIDLGKLRPYLPIDALEKAVRAAIKAGVRKIDGVEIYENKVAR